MRIQVATKPEKREIWLGMSYTQAAFVQTIIQDRLLHTKDPGQHALCSIVIRAISSGFDSAIEHTDPGPKLFRDSGLF